MGERIRLATEPVREKDVVNFEGMYYHGKKEGVDFLLCPRDKKTKCLNFTASPPQYPHAMDMYNDGGEKSFCRHCQTGAPKRQSLGKERLATVHERNQRYKAPGHGVRVGNHRIPYRPRRVA